MNDNLSGPKAARRLSLPRRVSIQEGKKKVTLRDIAEKTGLSVNTVSRVLNKKPYYTKEVEEKVNAACKELGYIVDMNASGLRSGSTRTVAILYDDLVNPFYSYTTDIISKRLEERGYNCIMFSNNDRSPYVDYELMRNVMARKPDAILSYLEPQSDLLDFIKNTGIPFVIFGRDGTPYGMTGIKKATEFLQTYLNDHDEPVNYYRAGLKRER